VKAFADVMHAVGITTATLARMIAISV